METAPATAQTGSAPGGALVLNTKVCPLCGATLPDYAEACTRCDWVAPHREHHATGTPRDAIAAALSIVPGAGHLYKGHKLAGWIIMAGTLLVVFGVGVIATYTAGFGLLLLPFYWLWVVTLAYFVEDRAAIPVAH